MPFLGGGGPEPGGGVCPFEDGRLAGGSPRAGELEAGGGLGEVALLSLFRKEAAPDDGGGGPPGRRPVDDTGLGGGPE